MWIRGDKLTPKQRAEVLAAFCMRHLGIGVWPDDEAYLKAHCFCFTKNGSRLSRGVKHCRPAFIAEGGAA